MPAPHAQSLLFVAFLHVTFSEKFGPLKTLGFFSERLPASQLLRPNNTLFTHNISSHTQNNTLRAPTNTFGAQNNTFHAHITMCHTEDNTFGALNSTSGARNITPHIRKIKEHNWCSE